MWTASNLNDAHTALCTIPKDIHGTAEGCQTLITKILGLKSSLDSIDPLLDAMEKLTDDCALSTSFKSALSTPRIRAIRDEISQVLDDNLCGGGGGKGGLNVQSQRCMAVRPGINTLLDVTRQAFLNVTEDVYALAQSYAEEYDMGSIKVAWSAKRGYHISVKVGAVQGVATSDQGSGAIFLWETRGVDGASERRCLQGLN